MFRTTSKVERGSPLGDSMAGAPVSLTPGFNPVTAEPDDLPNRFNGFAV